MTGFLLGSGQKEPAMGRTMWVRLAWHALAEGVASKVYRQLYTSAGAEWVTRGYFNHYIQIPAVDEAALWTWFGLGFGQQQVHASLELTAYSQNKNTVWQDLTIRQAGPGDEEILAGFSGTIAVYQTGAPVWAPMAAGELEELRQGYAELATDKEAITWLAFEGDQAVGMQAYFPVSPGIENPLVPDNAIELKVGSTQPQARGIGIASALTQHALWDAKEKGYAWCLIDWRSTNLLSSSFWPRFGFEPVAYRLERRVDERVGDGEQMNQMIM